jgi:transcriptional regulator with XRE-family HTH domain
VLNVNLLKAAIVREGLTQGEFAQKIGISPNTLTSRLSGTVPFNVDEVDKACEVLNLNDYEEICNIFLSKASQKWDKE